MPNTLPIPFCKLVVFHRCLQCECCEAIAEAVAALLPRHGANKKRLGDTVGIWTREGWLYLAALLAPFPCLGVGWAMRAARNEALAHGQIETSLIDHTDRGSH